MTPRTGERRSFTGEVSAATDERIDELGRTVQAGAHGDDMPTEPPSPTIDGLAATAFGTAGGGPNTEVLRRGEAVGRYLVLSRIGEGGMGVVYAVHDPDLDRKVAIKLLRSGATIDAESNARLLREAQALAKLAHPNVVAVHDVGTRDDQIWIAMEFLTGVTLSGWSRQKRRGWREVVATYLQAGAGLAAAHDAGLVHRDFKPQNAMLAQDGRVRVMDFGLARSGPGNGGPANVWTPGASPWSAVTEAGSLMGTPMYMAPEQWNGEAVDARCDQFAFCVALWQALYGRHPFAGETMAELRAAIIGGNRSEPPAGAKVPTWLRRVLARGMHGDPAQRWPTMAALLHAIESGTPRRRRQLALVVAGLVAGLVAGGVAYQQHSAQQRAEACHARGQELAATWDAARAGIAAAFVAAAPDVGERSFHRAATAIDRFVAEWASARGRSCMLPHLDARWTAELVGRADECLLESRWELESTLDRFAASDAALVRQAAAAVASLQPPAPCLDLSYLSRQPPPPPDEPVRAEVLRTRHALLQARTLGATGRFEEALAETRRLIVEADTIGWRPLAALARVSGARFAVDRSDLKSAEMWLDEAMVLAAETGQDALLADIATSMTDVVGIRLARLDEGLRWGKLALAMRTAQGDVDALRGTRTLSTMAMLRLERGELAEAEQLLERCLAVERRLAGPDSPGAAGALNNLGNVYRRSERYEDARIAYQRSLAAFERNFGPDHPNVALALANLASMASWRGDLDEAERLSLRALAIRERTAGPEGLETARAQQALGAVYLARQRTAMALELYERAAITIEKTLGPMHPGVADAMINLGDLHLERDDLERAEHYFTRALQITEAARGHDHLDNAWSLGGLGEIAEARGRGDEAMRRFARAEALYAANEHPREAAWARFCRARVLDLARSTRAEAHALAMQAAAELTALGAAEDRAEIDEWLAGRGTRATSPPSRE